MADQVVTSFSPAGAQLYGRRMVQTYLAHWPETTPLVVYLDARLKPSLPVETRWTSTLADWAGCLTRWAPYPSLHGRSTPERPLSKPYKYQHDVARFAVKLFVMRDAAVRLARGVLTWLDGDTVTTRSVPAGFTTALLGDADVAYLGRGSMHPETGYLGFRIPEALPLLDWCCETYMSDRVLAITTGWTDCHVIREGLAAVPVKARDLTGQHYTGRSHIWPVSPLAPYVTHYKGRSKREADRKRAGGTR
ncbi:MAG TPA: hypothetical protein VMW48_11235 [Vicinamibacterales bacterium]|nr:hypothetical protein [Vicinamibacterales bacterium]